MTTPDAEIVPVVRDRRGNLAFIENGRGCAFVPGRIEWGVGDWHDVDGALCGRFDGTRLQPPAALRNAADKRTMLMLAPGGGPENIPAADYSDPHRSADATKAVVLPMTAVAGGYRAAAPFAVRRIFYIYEAPEGAVRGGHSHYRDEQLLVAVAGKVRVRVSDGRRRRTFILSSPSEGLYVPPGLWVDVDGFSAESVLLVLCSTDYSATDYVRSWRRYVALTCRRIATSDIL